MLTLYHHPLLASCRFIRLILGEYSEDFSLVDVKPWERSKEFLSINPAGTLPVLVAEGGLPVCGSSVIAEFLDETRGVLMRDRRLLADDPFERAEVRRLVDWYLFKMDNDVTRFLVRERAFKRLMPGSVGGGAPDSSVLRAARGNVKQHMKYTAWLANRSNWLGGDGCHTPTWPPVPLCLALTIWEKSIGLNIR